MTTKPTGDQASFLATCHLCNGELTITKGRIDYHDCRPISLADIRAALDNR
jgi:hypothetical protein